MSHLSHPEPSGSRPRAFDTTSKLAAGVIGLLSVLAGLAMGIGNPFLNRAASAEGALIDALFSIILGITTTVFVIVQGFLLYSIVRFRRRPGDESDGLPIRGNTRLEVAWTAIPAIAVVFIGILSYQVLAAIERPRGDALIVEVKAVQYAWEFYYPEYDLTTTELHVPADQQVLLRLRSEDVIHSFWVPEFRIKKDVMPDRTTETYITGAELGAYPVVCTELCGAGHALMRSKLVVQSDADFKTWIAGQKAGAAAAGASESRAMGRQLFVQNGCDACHTLRDAKAAGTYGPNLDDIGAHADDHVPGQSAEDYLRLAITKPNDHVVEGYAANIMPQDYGLRIPEQDLAELVRYLMEMK
jgi:cytochrome c oxidase subunit 2